ncbi:hypothetical protein AB0E62_36005 [Streptomyces sp. NPDC038707]|uniref:hypothetical protein n=1 Tax=Streptomyces sp. NPDC038707 TaxID=3154329 RepID=UPI0033CA352C
MTAAATAPDQGAAQQPAPIGALSQLIQDALDKGDSYGKLAERAIDPETGETVSKPYLQRVVKNPPANPPTVPMMRAIAAALRKPFRHVQEATARQWLMYESTDLAGYGDTVRIIVSHLAGMPDSEKRKWQAMIEAAERTRRESGE